MHQIFQNCHYQLPSAADVRGADFPYTIALIPGKLWKMSLFANTLTAWISGGRIHALRLDHPIIHKLWNFQGNIAKGPTT